MIDPDIAIFTLAETFPIPTMSYRMGAGLVEKRLARSRILKTFLVGIKLGPKIRDIISSANTERIR